jgi:hypothetical protein
MALKTIENFPISFETLQTHITSIEMDRQPMSSDDRQKVRSVHEKKNRAMWWTQSLQHRQRPPH